MDLLTPFLEYLKFEKRASAHTITSYETDLKQFLEFQKEHFTIQNLEIGRAHV